MDVRTTLYLRYENILSFDFFTFLDAGRSALNSQNKHYIHKRATYYKIMTDIALVLSKIKLYRNHPVQVCPSPSLSSKNKN
jgi:hypothetical protein